MNRFAWTTGPLPCPPHEWGGVWSHRWRLVRMNEVDWARIVDALGYPSAGLGILIESAGVPFPGEALRVPAAAGAATRHPSRALVIFFGFFGARAGADLGSVLGHRGGRPFVERFGGVFRIRPDHLARAELFFARHGDKAILVARFVLGLRTWASMLAGMARMPFWRFQLFSAAGGLAWAAAIGVAGYLLGTNLQLLETIIRAIGIGGPGFLLGILFGFVVAPETATRPRGGAPPPPRATPPVRRGPRRGRGCC